METEVEIRIITKKMKKNNNNTENYRIITE